MDDVLDGGRREAVASTVADHAAGNGLAITMTDDEVQLQFDDRRHEWRAVWSEDGSAAEIRSLAPGRHDFLVADRVSPSAARILRKAGISFADATGNLYVRAPGVFVDLQRRRATRSSREEAWHGRRAAPTSWNLMSAARAQVVFCLLEWPELVGDSLRLLAHTAGVSLGSVQSALAALEDEHHLTRGRTRLTRRGDLLDQWAAAFPAGLGRKMELASFVGEPTTDAWVARGHEVHVSGGYTVEEIIGGRMVVYVDALDSRAVMASRWRAPRSGDEVANIVVRRRFWRPPSSWGRQGLETVSAAPETLVYADLLASGEPRERDAAKRLRDRLA